MFRDKRVTTGLRVHRPAPLAKEPRLMGMEGAGGWGVGDGGMRGGGTVGAGAGKGRREREAKAARARRLRVITNR